MRQHLTYANVGTTIALVLGASGFAVAAAPKPTTNVIRACVAKHGGQVRVRATRARCRKSERPLSWNRVGQPGPPGASGVFTGYSKAESDARYVPSSRFTSGIPRSTTAGAEAIPSQTCLLGTMMPFAGTTAPTGWSFAHGQELKISDHVELFSVLGQRYGGSAAASTFALPDAYDLGPGGTNWLICTGGQPPS